MAARKLRSRVGSAQPRLVVEQLWVKQLPPTWQLGPAASLRVDRVASRWNEQDEPAHLSIHAPAVAMQLEADLRFGEASQVHDIQCRFTNLRLVELIGPVTNEDRLSAYGGEVTLEVEGRALEDNIDLYAEVEADHPRLRVLGQEPWCGISPALWNRGFAEFDSFESRFRILGSWRQPVVRVDGHQLQRQLKHQLAAYGITEQAPEDAPPADGAGEAPPQMANAPTEDSPVALPEDNTPPAEEAADETDTYADADTPSAEAPEESWLSGSSIPGPAVGRTDSYASEEYEPLPYTDYSTNPLLGSVPPEQGLPLPEQTPPPMTDQQPVEQPVEEPVAVDQQPAENAALPQAVANTAPAATGLANPLRSSTPVTQEAAPEYPSYVDAYRSNQDSPYEEPTETYDSQESAEDTQFSLPESVVASAPGLIDFEQGYDQSRIPPLDLDESETTPSVEHVAQSTADLPSETEEPRRPGRISRWTRSVTSRVRGLWPGGDDSEEALASDMNNDFIDRDILEPEPMEGEPVFQARRENEMESNLPWYRRLW